MLPSNTPVLRLRAAIAASALLAFGCCLLVAASVAQAADPFTMNGGAAPMTQPVAAPSGAFVGKKSIFNGHIDGHSGKVRLSAKLGGKGKSIRVGTARADADGDFTFAWKPPKAGLYNIQIDPAPGIAALAQSAAAPASGSLSVYRRQKATWYGPGFYGSRTACGQKLTRSMLGVAHRTLPCGTQVEFFLRGKRITVPVIDRGPFVRGVVWDLTVAAMKELGSTSTEYVGALALGK